MNYDEPSANGSPRIVDLFQGVKTGVPSGCLGETSVFKIIMTDDVTLWSTIEST